MKRHPVNEHLLQSLRWALPLLILVTICGQGCQTSSLIVSDGGGTWPGLLNQDAAIRTQTIHLIQQTGNSEYVPLLFPVLTDEDRWVRYNARAVILILSGSHAETAPPFEYLGSRKERIESQLQHVDWWQSLFPGSTS